MRRLSPLLLLVALPFTLAACGVAYVSPVLQEDEIRADSALLGEWVDASPEQPDRAARAIIRPAPAVADAYAITYVDEDGRVSEFEARLGDFAGHRLLQLRPAAPRPRRDGTMGEMLTVRAYAFLFIQRVDARELSFTALDLDALEQSLKRDRDQLPWVASEDVNVLVTAETPRLRAWLAAYLRRPGVMSEAARWVRAPAGR